MVSRLEVEIMQYPIEAKAKYSSSLYKHKQILLVSSWNHEESIGSIEIQETFIFPHPAKSLWSDAFNARVDRPSLMTGMIPVHGVLLASISRLATTCRQHHGMSLPSCGTTFPERRNPERVDYRLGTHFIHLNT